MTDRDPFPDIEAALVDLLLDLADGGAGTVTPADLQGMMPYLRVQRFGGADDGITDALNVSIDAFAADRATSRALAEAVRQRLLTGPHVVGEATIDKAITLTAPNEVPWSDSQAVRRFTASYRVTARR